MVQQPPGVYISVVSTALVDDDDTTAVVNPYPTLLLYPIITPVVVVVVVVQGREAEDGVDLLQRARFGRIIIVLSLRPGNTVVPTRCSRRVVFICIKRRLKLTVHDNMTRIKRLFFFCLLIFFSCVYTQYNNNITHATP